MILFTRQGVARASRGLRCAFDAAKELIAVARAWRWGAVALRVVLAGLGLALLGVIGRSAFARTIPPTESPPAVDAGTVATMLPTLALPAATAPPSPLPPSSASSPLSTAAPADPARGRATPEDPVYLNQATLSDLHRLPGVGPKRAEAILALRTKLGHFRQIEDLLKVKGIGRSSLRKLRPLVRLDTPASAVHDGGAAGAP